MTPEAARKLAAALERSADHDRPEDKRAVMLSVAHSLYERRLENRSHAALKWLWERSVTLEEEWRKAGASTDRIDTIQFISGMIKDAIHQTSRTRADDEPRSRATLSEDARG